MLSSRFDKSVQDNLLKKTSNMTLGDYSRKRGEENELPLWKFAAYLHIDTSTLVKVGRDANTKQALKFLRGFKAITHQTVVEEAWQHPQPVVESGTYTPLANELKRLSQKFFTKREITISQVDNLLAALAKKYDALPRNDDEAESEEIDISIRPEIVLSETFIE